MSGLYVVFEGTEGTGKTSAMHAVAEHFKDSLNPVLTHHPGSTPLGAHLRQLVKYPHTINKEIRIDPFARQCLYMADAISFIETLLKPAISNGQTVFADRSAFISSMIYGTADGVDSREINKLLHLIDPPKADRLYILQCPHEISMARTRSRGSLHQLRDHYDNQPDEFLIKVTEKYAKLLTGSVEQLMMVSRVAHLDNIVYIESSRPQQQVVDDIIKDLSRHIAEREIT
jgi:dTMP kinase